MSVNTQTKNAPDVVQLRGATAEQAVGAGVATVKLGSVSPDPVKGTMPPLRPGEDVPPTPTTPPKKTVVPPPVLPPRPKEKPDPDEALAKIEKLGTEVPGMLRTLDAEVQTAIRLDFADFGKVRSLRDAKNGFPVDKVDNLATDLEELRKRVVASAKGAQEAWQRIYAPYVDRPRTLHDMADHLDDIRRKVEAMDEFYEELDKPKEGWTGADADAYKARVKPQRMATEEFAGLIGLLKGKVVHVAMLHATVYVVVHQQLQGVTREIKGANAAKGGGGELGVRMSLAASRLDYLADWLETYSQRADWLGQVGVAGSAMAKLSADTSYFPKSQWPEATVTTVAPTNTKSAVEVQKAADLRDAAARKAAEDAYAKAVADLKQWEADRAAEKAAEEAAKAAADKAAADAAAKAEEELGKSGTPVAPPIGQPVEPPPPVAPAQNRGIQH